MPGTSQPAARLVDVTVAEVAEAIEAPLRDQLRHSLGKDLLVVYSVTAERRAITVLLWRDDDAFVWVVAAARPMGGAEFETWLGRIGAMSELPDFETMTRDEIRAWFLSSDTSALLARAEPADTALVEVDEHDEPVMRPATFRLPPLMIEWLEHAAGRDREGKSGIVRRALQEYRERHDSAA
jgi:hypothetical protein